MYLAARGKKKDFLAVDEVWVINSLIGTLEADKAFIMDDLRDIESRYPAWANTLKLTDVPIITCREYPEYPTAEAYPIQEVQAFLNDDWFTNTVAYAVGYAALIGVQDFYMFGCDFKYPGSSAVEAGHDNVCYLLGLARSKGLRYRIPQQSTLMDTNLAQLQDGQLKRPLYGYDFNPGDCANRVAVGRATEMDKQLAERGPRSQ